MSWAFRLVGTVIKAEIQHTPTRGGVIRFWLDRDRDWPIYLSKNQFELYAEFLRPKVHGHLRAPFEEADGERIVRWMVGRQAKVRVEGDERTRKVELMEIFA